MKFSIFCASLFVLATSANASLEHECFPEKSDSTISQVKVSSSKDAYTLTITHHRGMDKNLSVDYYDDITFIGFISNVAQYDLAFTKQNRDGVWSEATLNFGNNFQYRLSLVCH